MGDMGDMYKALKGHRKDERARLGVPCPNCKKRLPKAHPKILMPGQKCWCGYMDPREKEGEV
jgi:hypothetical protein